MSNLKQIQEENKGKELIEVGDICVSNKYGVGYITEISQEDVWYPITVLFKPMVYEFGDFVEKRKYFHYSTKGCTNSIHQHEKNGDEIVDAKFYKLIKIY
jgi:hypothetical protein